jgi:hypothetical protein
VSSNVISFFVLLLYFFKNDMTLKITIEFMIN